MSAETFAKLRRQASLQARARQEPGPSYELLPNEPALGFAAASGAGRPATSSSTWKATRYSSRAADSNTSSAAGCPTTRSPIVRSGATRGAPRRSTRSSSSSTSSPSAGESFRQCTSTTMRATRSRRCGGWRKSTARAKRKSTISCAREVLVDLFTVVRQALAISEEKYGLKNLERFYQLQRQTETKKGDDSILMFERWLIEPRSESSSTTSRPTTADDCRVDLSTARVAAGAPRRSGGEVWR